MSLKSVPSVAMRYHKSLSMTKTSPCTIVISANNINFEDSFNMALSWMVLLLAILVNIFMLVKDTISASLAL